MTLSTNCNMSKSFFHDIKPKQVIVYEPWKELDRVQNRTERNKYLLLSLIAR